MADYIFIDPNAVPSATPTPSTTPSAAAASASSTPSAIAAGASASTTPSAIAAGASASTTPSAAGASASSTPSAAAGGASASSTPSANGASASSSPSASSSSGSSASSTPSNSASSSPSASASSAPPAEQDVLVPYLLSSADMCASTEIANKFLDPSTGIAINLRYSMATSLGYNGSAAFVSGLVLCDNTYLPVDKDAAINTVNADTPFNGTTKSSSSISNRRRRLYDMLNKLNLPINGQTIVVELGVSVPAVLAPALTNLMVALITNAPASEIQALAANLSAAMATPEFLSMYPPSDPNAAVALPASLLQTINTAANSGNAPSFTAALAAVPNAALSPIITALNLSSTVNISGGIISNGIRGGEITTYMNNNNGNTVTPAAEESKGSGALGALAVIPIVILIVFGIVWYRRRQQSKGAPVKSKSLDNNFTDVATTSNIDLDSMSNESNVKVDFAPTGADSNGTFENVNPLKETGPSAGGLTIRRTVVQINSGADSKANGSSA